MTNEDVILFKDLINSKFTGLDSVLKSIDDHLKHINGSVAEHDKDIRQALVERSGNRQSQLDHLRITEEIDKRLKILEEKVISLEKININHVNICPQAPRIKLLEDEVIKSQATKMFVVKTVSITALVVTIIWTIYKLFFMGGGS